MQVGKGAPVRIYEETIRFKTERSSFFHLAPPPRTTNPTSPLLGNDAFYTVLKDKFTDSHSLYLFCSGGRGHRSAKEALVEEALHPIYTEMREQYPHDTRCRDFASFLSYCITQKWVSELDVLKDCLGCMGKGFSHLWNWALQKCHPKIIHALVALQGMFDSVYGLIIFLRILWVLWKKKISRVISTQPLGLKATLWAIRIYNRCIKKNLELPISVSLYLTDFPSKGASHFLRPLQDLPEGSKNLLHLYLPSPNRSGHTTPSLLSHFSQEKIQLLPSDRFPVRKAFRIRQPSHLHGEENAFFCMLGSHPHWPTLVSYLSLFQRTAKKWPRKNWSLFLYRGDTSSARLKKQAALSPSNLRVALLGPQSAEQLSSLFWNCHTITRAGGSTLMELISLEHQRQNANVSLKWRDIHTEQALYEVPSWERENANIFLKNLVEGQSRLVSPSTYASIRLDESGFDIAKTCVT